MTGIYARQSVERPDSISVAMQVELCRQLIPPEEPCRVFTDRGFSGTTTDRPAYQEMLEAVSDGTLQAVYVYKLDRISRSLCDFAAMMELFRRRGVTLRSVREQFDTHTEIGGMLLHLLILFAELEQKTIAGRVRDNYYARAEQQLALGGSPPYGYQAVPLRREGHHTTTLAPLPAEAAQVVWFYTGYGIRGENVEQLVQAANQQGSRTRRGARWSNSAVLRILRNPVYVQGDLRSGVYFQEQGAILVHPLELYCQGNGSLVYGSRAQRQGTRLTHLTGEHIAAGLHPGIVESALWLGVQERLQRRGGSTNRGTGQTSWLQGSVVCGLCGTHCYARNNGAGAQYTYFVCRGKRQGICPGIPALRVEEIERRAEPVLLQRGAACLSQAAAELPEAECLALEQLEQQMRNLAEELSHASASAAFLRGELERLAAEREQYAIRLRGQLQQNAAGAGTRWETWWRGANLRQRRQAAEILLEEVRVFPTRMEIRLK